MAVSAGHDYAIARKTTWFFESGMGNSTAIVTPNSLFIFPHKTMSSTSRSMTDTTFTINGQHPYQAIQELLAAPDATRETIEAQLQKWASDQKDPIVEPLSVFKRMKIFTGWIRRSVVFSKKDKGFEFNATSVRPKKDEIKSWVDIFRDFPDITIK